MAMLAERRNKQKWSLNPRGTLWTNDDNKFGQKLLEKMGWSKGEGLGKEGQGHKDCVSVRMKNDTKGIGYKGKEDQWIKYYEGFESVLAALNTENNSAVNSPFNSTPNSNVNSDEEDTKRPSLEALSKKSQSRLHYHKFTRGKDLSRCDADAIAIITGSKRAKRLAEEAKKMAVEEEEEVGTKVNSNGVTTIKAGNVQEYFAKKMALLKSRTNQQSPYALEVDAADEDDNAEDEPFQDDYEREYTEKSEDEEKGQHVQGGEDAEMQEQEENDNPECEGKLVKKKKSKKNKVAAEESALDSGEIKEKKKKKSKTSDNSIRFERDDETHKDNSYVEEPRRKKKKAFVDVLENNKDNGENCHVEEPQKKKKKRKAKDVQGNEAESELLENECDSEKVSKKRKKHLEENVADNEIPNECNAEETKSKKKKKVRAMQR